MASSGYTSPEETGEIDSASTTQCLFCLAAHLDLTSTLTHMQKVHGFMIPRQELLLVDLETLVTYLRLVIEDYCECLSCGTQRATGEGARQHMLARRHCGFDLEDEDSELREFYDWTVMEEDEVSVQTLKPVEDGFVRLDSGKVLGKQRTQTRRQFDRSSSQPDVGTSTLEESTEMSRDASNSSVLSDSTKAVDRPQPAEKKALALGTQLTRLSAADRTALAHLAPSEQRSRLAICKKQIDKARRSQRAMQSRVDRLGNKTLMKHFVTDVPGRKNG